MNPIATIPVGKVCGLSERMDKIESLLRTALEARLDDVTKAYEIALEALRLAEEAAEGYWINRARCDLSLYCMISSQYEEALRYGTLAKAYFQENNDAEGLSSCLYNIASVYYKTDEYHLGLQYMLECFQYKTLLGDEPGQSRSLKAIGTIYEYLGDVEAASEAYQRCINLSRKCGDLNGESNALNPLSGLYLKSGKSEMALEAANESIRLKKLAGDERGLGFAFHAKGKVYLHKKEFSRAEKAFDKSLRKHRKSGEKIGESMALEKLGKLFYLQNDFARARKYLEEALETAYNYRYYLILHKVYYHLYNMAKDEEDYQQALEYHELYQQYYAKVTSSETKSLIKSLKSASRMEMLEREAEIQRVKNEEIEAKNKELDTFVYKASHDLRGPISSLLGLNTLIEQDVTDPKAMEYFGFYKQQTERLHHIVTELINLTRIKKWEVKLSEIDFTRIVDTCIRQYQYLPKFSSIHFDVEIAADLKYASDELTVVTIMQNLIENAIKYARVNQKKSWVEVRIGLEADRVNILVRDNGIGIKEEYQDRIFEMFFRANDSGEGSGLGLYILKNAVDKLNGYILVESTYGEGSTFSISLPYTAITVEKQAASA